MIAGNIIEEDHYYAYGLKIADISSKKLGDSFEGLLKNNNLYNDKELFDDGDLNWYDYGFRNYDPQIGRFTQLDPLTDDYPELTPYQYASCDPITNIDIDGLEGGDAVVTGFIHHAASLVSDAPTVFAGSTAVLANSSRVIPTAEKAASHLLSSVLKVGVHVVVNTVTAINNSGAVQRGLDGIKNPAAQTASWLQQNFKNVNNDPITYLSQTGSGGCKECDEHNYQVSQRLAVAKQAQEQAGEAEVVGNMVLSVLPIEELLIDGVKSLGPVYKAVAKIAVKGRSNIYFRYMTEAELKAVQNTGLLRGGRAGETFFTKDLYKSAASAQNRLALPTAPTFRVEFQILNNPTLLRNGTKVLPANGMMGKGAEFMTLDPVNVKLINWQPLR